jgi:SAM-dependent methyltransferase
MNLLKPEISELWNSLAERFNTHKPLAKVHPDAAVNIHVGWPVLFQQLEYQSKYVGQKKLSILDFGCGSGEFCQRVHTMGHCVTGMDHSKSMLIFARQHLPKEVSLIHGNHVSPFFKESEYFNSYDVITAIHSLEWIQDIEITLLNLSKLLKPGGIMLFAVFPKNHVIDSIKIKDLFEDFDDAKNPSSGYCNFDGVRVPVYIRDASFFDSYYKKLDFDKVLEAYPPYPKYFLDEYKWTGSKHPEMMVLAYRKC